MKSNTPRKIFISYGEGDIKTAQRLRDDLKRAGLNLWLDREDLYAGDNWKLKIREAIRESDFFVPLISEKSADKVGHFQAELKLALEIQDTHPASGRFIIPVRLDDVRSPDDRLRDIHWVDLFPSYLKGLERLVKAVDPDLDIPEDRQAAFREEVAELHRLMDLDVEESPDYDDCLSVVERPRSKRRREIVTLVGYRFFETEPDVSAFETFAGLAARAIKNGDADEAAFVVNRNPDPASAELARKDNIDLLTQCGPEMFAPEHEKNIGESRAAIQTVRGKTSGMPSTWRGTFGNGAWTGLLISILENGTLTANET